jgi:hypothetical protein
VAKTETQEEDEEENENELKEKSTIESYDEKIINQLQ